MDDDTTTQFTRRTTRPRSLPPFARGRISGPFRKKEVAPFPRKDGTPLGSDQHELLREYSKPFKRICASILVRAAYDMKNRKERDQVIHWMNGRYESAVPFETCCDALDRDLGATKEAMLRL